MPDAEAYGRAHPRVTLACAKSCLQHVFGDVSSFCGWFCDFSCETDKNMKRARELPAAYPDTGLNDPCEPPMSDRRRLRGFPFNRQES